MNKTFFVNFFSLNVSSFLNRVLNFLLFIFLIRYLTTAEYGIYNLVWAHISLLSPFVDFGTTTYGLVHLAEEKKRELSTLLSLRLSLAVIMVVLTILLAIIFQYSVSIILFIVLTSVVIISNMWSGSYLLITSVKQKSYLASIVSIVFNSFYIAFLIVQLFFFKSLSFIFYFISVFYLIYAVLNYFLVKYEVGQFNLIFDIEAWKNIVKKSYMFVLISFFAGLYFKLDVILLKMLRTPAEVGIYSAGYKFLDAFMFIAASYSFVGTPILSKRYNSDTQNFQKKVWKDVIFLSGIGLGAAIANYVLAPFVLRYILHGDFTYSLSVLRVVIWALPFILATTVFLNALYIMKKTQWVVGLFMFQTVFNLSMNMVFIPRYSYIGSAYITVIGEVLNAVITLIMVRILIRKSYE